MNEHIFEKLFLWLWLTLSSEEGGGGVIFNMPIMWEEIVPECFLATVGDILVCTCNNVIILEYVKQSGFYVYEKRVLLKYMRRQNKTSVVLSRDGNMIGKISNLIQHLRISLLIFYSQRAI